MKEDIVLSYIREKTETLISADTDVFLVDLRIGPSHNIQIILDSDFGITIDRLAQYNRLLYKEIQTSGMFKDGDFSLELSSPGAEEPLKFHRQYVKNVGRVVEVIRKDGIKTEGLLKEVTENEILLETRQKKQKRQELSLQVIPFEEIKTTRVLIQF
ncbi:MAG: ribosome maturation factor [Chitinophagaceae bacterium]|nr:ribosome maturation factor [Chitinophagaceae bacterium]